MAGGNKMKKISLLAITLILCLLMTACGTNSPIGYNTDEGGSDGKFTYDIVSQINRTATITGYTGDSTSISIPETIDGYKVVGIYSLPDCDSVTKIKIPDTITEISKDAFRDTGCFSDEENWFNDVLYIGDYLIMANSDIVSCTVKEGTKYIAEYAFEDCYKLESVVLPNSLVGIGDYAFMETNLENVVFGTDLKKIGDGVFHKCKKIINIHLPQSVESIGAGIFDGTNIIDYDSECLYMDNWLIWVNKGYEGEFQVQKGTVGIAGNAFDRCKDITNIIIPDSVSYIGYGAFGSCDSLSSLNIGENVTYLGEQAFYDCENLVSIILPETLSYLGDQFAQQCQKLSNISFSINNKFFISDENGEIYTKDKKTLIYVPRNTEGIYDIPNSVENICAYAFEYCDKITKINIPSQLKNIGDYAFSELSGITEILIPGTVERIGRCAFSSCESLNTVEIQSGVKSIGDKVFAHSKSLTTVKIPANVSNVDYRMFEYSEVANVYFAGSEEQWTAYKLSYIDGVNIHYAS